MPTFIKKNHFSGLSHVHSSADAGLANVLRRVMQYATAVSIGTGMTALTDSSGGNAANSSANASKLTPALLSGTNLAQKAELEASFGNIKDALTEIGAKLLADNALVPSNPLGTITNSVGGAAADGTIAAIDVSMTAVNTSCAAYAGSQTVLTNIVALMKQQTYHINRLANLVGVAELTFDLESVATVSTSAIFAALSTGTGTAVDGSNLTTQAGVTKTEVDAVLVKLANYVAKMAAKLNAIQAYCDAPTPLIFAG